MSSRPLEQNELSLKADQQHELDAHVLAGRIILGIRFVWDCGAPSLPAAMEVFTERYRELRQDRPEAFTKDLEDYWDGFYS